MHSKSQSPLLEVILHGWPPFRAVKTRETPHERKLACIIAYYRVEMVQSNSVTGQWFAVQHSLGRMPYTTYLVRERNVQGDTDLWGDFTILVFGVTLLFEKISAYISARREQSTVSAKSNESMAV